MKFKRIKVKIKGIKPIIFNNFVSIDDTNIPIEKKIRIENGKIVIDSDRLMSFLSANNTKTGSGFGCIKLFTKSTEYKKLLPKVNAYIGIEPIVISISKDDKYEIREDKVGGGGVPQNVKRPMVKDWGAEFYINLIENPSITFDKLKDWFIQGGIEIGLGAWRPRYGQFIVEEFEEIKK